MQGRWIQKERKLTRRPNQLEVTKQTQSQTKRKPTNKVQEKSHTSPPKDSLIYEALSRLPMQRDSYLPDRYDLAEGSTGCRPLNLPRCWYKTLLVLKSRTMNITTDPPQGKSYKESFARNLEVTPKGSWIGMTHFLDTVWLLQKLLPLFLLAGAWNLSCDDFTKLLLKMYSQNCAHFFYKYNYSVTGSLARFDVKFATSHLLSVPYTAFLLKLFNITPQQRSVEKLQNVLV